QDGGHALRRGGQGRAIAGRTRCQRGLLVGHLNFTSFPFASQLHVTSRRTPRRNAVPERLGQDGRARHACGRLGTSRLFSIHASLLSARRVVTHRRAQPSNGHRPEAQSLATPKRRRHPAGSVSSSTSSTVTTPTTCSSSSRTGSITRL